MTSAVEALLGRPEWRLAVAVVIGLLVGAERERKRAAHERTQPAGIRTFALVALLGGAAPLVGTGAVVLGGAFVALLALAGYALGERDDVGYTTEVALVLTYALAALAQHYPGLALAAGVVEATVLATRAQLHHWVRDVLSDRELLDGLAFAVAAIVVLPLVPDRALGPLDAVNPFVLWRLVVVIMALEGAGYVAQRAVGSRFGLPLAGLASGFVSSTATIAAMGARARADESATRAAAAGATTATVSSMLELTILVATASPTMARALALPLVASGGAAAGYGAVLTWRSTRTPPRQAVEGRAFEMRTALLFATLVAGISLASKALLRWLGSAGALGAASVAGFVDTHAVSASLASIASGGGIRPEVAELGIVLAVTANSIAKAVLSFSTGTRGFATRVTVGLALVAVALWLGWLAHGLG